MSDTAYVVLHVSRRSGKEPVITDAGIYSEFPLTVQARGDWHALLSSHDGENFHEAHHRALESLERFSRHDALHRWVLRRIMAKPRPPSVVVARSHRRR